MHEALATEPTEIQEEVVKEVAETEVDTEAEGDETETDHDEEDEAEASEDDAEPVDPDLVEVDFEGETVKVSQKVKDALMMRADYTRKTQEVAEQRKAFEAQVEAHKEQAKFESELGDEVIGLRAMDQELEQFRQLDWMKLQQEDPNLAQQMMIRFNTLKDQKEVSERGVAAKMQEARTKRDQQIAEHQAKVKSELASNVPGWNDVKESEVKALAKSIGFDESEVDTSIKNDWKIAKVLDLAALGQRVLDERQKTKKARPVGSKKPEPMPTLKGKATPNRGPTDRQPVDVWMRERHKELKTG